MKIDPQNLVTQTNALTTATSYIPCLSISAQQLFEEIVSHQDELIKIRKICFSTICDDSGKENKKRTKEHLPNSTDMSFESYHERVSQMINQDAAKKMRYQFIVRDIERFSMPVRDWLAEFYKPIFESIGVPSGKTYTSIFIGDYKTTTFGIHFDDEYAFHVPVIGKKRMLLWDYDKISYDELCSSPCDEDMEINAEPGTCVFWTPNYWHISSQSGQFSVSIANASMIGVRVQSKHLLKKIPLFIRRLISNQQTIMQNLRGIYEQEWANLIKKHRLIHNTFNKVQPIPSDINEKQLIEKLEHQSRIFKKTVLRNEKIVDYKGFSFKLDTNQEPLIHRMLKYTYVALNGHVYKDGESVLNLLNLFKTQTEVVYPSADIKIENALLWLYDIRAVSIKI